MTQLADYRAREWTPRYLAYCAAHGQTPDAMMLSDRDRWPGGCMTGFILWNSQQLRAFRAEHPECFRGDSLADHAAYDAFLAGGGA